MLVWGTIVTLVVRFRSSFDVEVNRKMRCTVETRQKRQIVLNFSGLWTFKKIYLFFDNFDEIKKFLNPFFLRLLNSYILYGIFCQKFKTIATA